MMSMSTTEDTKPHPLALLVMRMAIEAGAGGDGDMEHDMIRLVNARIEVEKFKTEVQLLGGDGGDWVRWVAAITETTCSKPEKAMETAKSMIMSGHVVPDFPPGHDAGIGANTPPASATDDAQKPDVFLYDWRGDDDRTLRVVVTADNDVSFEERTGRDAIGVDIWTPITFDEKDINGCPIMTRRDWAEVAVLAVLRGKRG